ncbi:MAG: redox-sensing transcriptional repressor Rex [Planctomycetia bacterium]|nr:redox-sensing transcriptional repressor Rex [Planctomycetia bacterium]
MKKIKLQNTPAIRRMPTYLHKLDLLAAEHEETVSTTKLAEYMNLDPVIVKKDFELTNVKGQPGVGYQTADLIEGIRRFLRWDQLCSATLVGVGALGSAILGFTEFQEFGMKITSVFDSNPDKTGTYVHGHEVLAADRMEEILKQDPPRIAVLCVPTSCSQEVAEKVVHLGIKAIWNFGNVSLSLPDDVIVQREVLAGGFAVLSSKLVLRDEGENSDQ